MMKTLLSIPHPHMNIHILKMNDKIILRIEAGPMEQIYKVPAEEFAGVENINKILQSNASDPFTAVFLSMKENFRFLYKNED